MPLVDPLSDKISLETFFLLGHYRNKSRWTYTITHTQFLLSLQHSKMAKKKEKTKSSEENVEFLAEIDKVNWSTILLKVNRSRVVQNVAAKKLIWRIFGKRYSYYWGKYQQNIFLNNYATCFSYVLGYLCYKTGNTNDCKKTGNVNVFVIIFIFILIFFIS